MFLNYSNIPVYHNKNLPSIFLAGPTPRSEKIQSWRKEAIKILENLQFKGIVYIPECNFFQPNFDYNNQIEWEWEAMEAADKILFWIPRSESLPGFTTNVEFGYWMAKNKTKVYYGRPDDSIRNKYLDNLYIHLFNNTKRPENSLFQLIKKIINNEE